MNRLQRSETAAQRRQRELQALLTRTLQMRDEIEQNRSRYEARLARLREKLPALPAEWREPRRWIPVAALLGLALLALVAGRRRAAGR
ncbi:MAG: hypothetical protein LBS10_07355 [Gracilibacteraceae bacterium]|jgi:predicted  nucleic acid-binding Zn-ribbon protein|nr:hypothetical protein [Gracilibacteraceae bacterium]